MDFFSLEKRRLEILVIQVYKIMKMSNWLSVEGVILWQILQYKRCEVPNEIGFSFKERK